MSAVIIDKYMVHYEMLGRGRPIIFLHSWLGSWRTWMPTMEVAADRYRVMALDFWGFGDSATPPDGLAIRGYVDQLNGFVEKLGIVTPHLVGHGLGGMVAVRAASEQPERYGKVLIVGTPLLGTAVRTSGGGALGRLLGRSGTNNEQWIKLVRQAAGAASDAANAGFGEIMEDIEATDPHTVTQVINELAGVDVRGDVARLACPLLAIYGGRDTILPTERGAEIEEVEGRFRQVLVFEKSGHFPFLDQPNQFARAVIEFFSDTDKVIELKAEWKRRVSQRDFL